MDERARIRTHMAFCENALSTIELRRLKGWAWLAEHQGWHAYLAADRCRLAELDGLAG